MLDTMNATDVLVLLGSAFGGFLAAFAALVGAVRYLVAPLVAAAVNPLYKDLGDVREKFGAWNAELNAVVSQLAKHEDADAEAFRSLHAKLDEHAKENRVLLSALSDKLSDVREDTGARKRR